MLNLEPSGIECRKILRASLAIVIAAISPQYMEPDMSITKTNS